MEVANNIQPWIPETDIAIETVRYGISFGNTIIDSIYFAIEGRTGSPVHITNLYFDEDMGKQRDSTGLSIEIDAEDPTRFRQYEFNHTGTNVPYPWMQAIYRERVDPAS
jgi:hypothetical protein